MNHWVEGPVMYHGERFLLGHGYDINGEEIPILFKEGHAYEIGLNEAMELKLI